MKIGIMQPYFLPYIGYWQLMNAVDKYVIYDDVNYIKGGWVNRNRMLTTAGKETYFTISLRDASSFKKINEIEILQVPDKILKSVQQVYRKATCFAEAYPTIEEIFRFPEKNLGKFLVHANRMIANYLGITTELIVSSELAKDNSQRADEKVLHICNLLGGDEYYNAIGGQALYSREKFATRGVRLSFVKTELVPYPQYKFDFVPGLSILDIMMFNDRDRLREMMGEYDLV